MVKFHTVKHFELKIFNYSTLSSSNTEKQGKLIVNFNYCAPKPQILEQCLLERLTATQI